MWNGYGDVAYEWECSIWMRHRYGDVVTVCGIGIDMIMINEVATIQGCGIGTGKWHRNRDVA